MNKLFKLFLVLVVVLGFGASVFAQDAAPAATEETATDEIVVDETATPAPDATVAPGEGAVEAPAHQKGDAVDCS
ncbi:MAG: ammonia channel protein, partial [Candidatus Riflebacteria bacterium]